MGKTFKRILASVLTVVMLLTAAPMSGFVGLDIDFGWLDFSTKASALDSSGSCGDNVTYTFDSETGLLTISGIGDMWDYYEEISPFNSNDSINSIIISYSVTRIGSFAFDGCTGLTSVTIPDSVTSIGNYAFRGCTGLISVTIPYRVKDIEYGAFNGCTGLTSIIVSCENTFYDNRDDCNAIIEKATNTLIRGCKNTTIPDSVTSIGDSAFSGCTGLTSITIPDSVTSIGSFAFRGCTGLTNITIPDSVTNIGSYAFVYTGYYSNTDNWEDNVLYIGNYLIEASVEISGSYKIKSGTKTIAGSAFDGCTGLTSITIPDSVTNIGEHAFYGCTGLTSIAIGNGVTSIGRSAFYGCTGLTSIIIPDSVTSIGGSAFYGCTGLTSIIIPDSVTSIGRSAFDGCTGLTSVTIPDSVTNIGECAFYSCTGLTSITIPDSVTSIGWSAFKGCTGLTSITIPDSVTSIESYAFENTGYYNNANNWEDNVLYIGNHLIKANVEISGSYTIKSGTKTIADWAFEYCSDLASIEIPDSVTNIGEYAFSVCTNLGSLTVYNRDCIFSDTATADYTTIYGFTGSTAETYANEKGFDFVAIDDTHTHVYDDDDDKICNLCGAERLVHYTLTPANGAVVDNENGLIYGIASNSADINSYVNTVDDTMTVECDSALLGTGSVVNIVKDDVIVDSYKIVLFGDVNGDGWYDGMDAVTVSCIANGMLTKDQIGEAAYMAADCNHDGVVDEFDVALLNQAGVLLANVDQTKTQEELAADSDYIEYLSLIDQTAGADTEQGGEQTPQPDKTYESLFEMIIDFIKTVFEILISIFQK